MEPINFKGIRTRAVEIVSVFKMEFCSEKDIIVSESFNPQRLVLEVWVITGYTGLIIEANYYSLSFMSPRFGLYTFFDCTV